MTLAITQPTPGTLAVAGGKGPYIWEVTAGRLPPGVSLTRQGVLEGTARAKGSAAVTVRCTDASVPTPLFADAVVTLAVG
jgi:hypothetical protein